MSEKQEQQIVQCIELTDEDFRAALRDLKTYVDISMDDVKAIASLALKHAQERVAGHVPVSAVMTRDVVSIAKDADLQEASRTLSEHKVSGMPVVDEEGRVIGIFTDSDALAMAGMERGHTLRRRLLKHLLGEPLPRRKEDGKVEDFMSTPAITVKPDTDIRDAAAILNEKQIKRLPVVDDENRLVGIISRADVVRAVGMK